MNKLLLEQMILEELMLETKSYGKIKPMVRDQYVYVGKGYDTHETGDNFVVNRVEGADVELGGKSNVSLQWNNDFFADNFKYTDPKNPDRVEREKTYFRIMSTETKDLSGEQKQKFLNLINQTYAQMDQDEYKKAKLVELANYLEGTGDTSQASTEPAEEASTEPTDDEQYLTLALELFPNIANRENGIQKLKVAYKAVKDLEIEKDRREKARITDFKRKNFDFDQDGDEDEEDVKIYNNTIKARTRAVANDPSIVPASLDDLLNIAASAASSDAEAAGASDGAGSAATDTSAVTTTDTGSAETDTDSDTADTTTTDTADADPDTTDTDTPDDEEDEVDPNLFVPTDKVNTQIEEMKEFYDQPYLYEQGTILRRMITALQGAMKAEERTAGIKAPNQLQEAKGLNVKNIKASLNSFLQQTRKVKKALDEYIEMAEQGKMGATRKKAILDKEVDRLIDYGKSIIKSLPKSLNEAEENTPSEGGTDLQPLHNFVNFVLGENSFEAIQKAEVQAEIDKVKPILKVFPNVAPFGQAQDLDIDLKDYSTKFQAAINDNLKTAIANFKSLQSGDGGEAAIEGLRNSLITFLGTGLSILGKSVDGKDLEDLEAKEAVSSEDDTASSSPSSAESIMSELGLDVGEEGQIQTSSDEEKAAKKLDMILNKLGTNKKYNTAKEISDFIYDQVKYERLSFGSVGKEGIKRVLRFMGLRKFISEAKEGEFDIEDFTQEFFTKIITMSKEYWSTKDKNKLRQASNELARASEQALSQYQKLSKTDPSDKSKKITNTGKTITDMFGEMHNTTSGYGKSTNALEMKYKKVFKHMQKSIKRLDFAAFINTLFKMDPELVKDNTSLFAIAKDISSKIIERDQPVIKNNGNTQKIISFEGFRESGEMKLVVPNEGESGGDSTEPYYLDKNYLEQDFKIEKLSSEKTSEQIERKLETIIEHYINNRKQQWRKRTT